MKVLIPISIMFLLISCKDNSNNASSNIEVRELYDNGALKSITFYKDELHKRKITYFQNGEIESIFHYKNDLLEGEQLWFHENGTIDQKVLYVEGQRNGNAYFFYPSGTLKHTRHFKDDIAVIVGANYWDGPLNIVK